MRGAVMVVGVLLLSACGGAASGSADASSAATTGQAGEPITIRLRLEIADKEGSEPIATGKVLEGSTVGDLAFCVGGTSLDSHASGDPAVEPYGLIDRTITCPDGSVRMGFTPDVVPGGRTWTIVSGTGAFDGIHGRGETRAMKDPDDDSRDLETLTGTVTR